MGQEKCMIQCRISWKWLEMCKIPLAVSWFLYHSFWYEFASNWTISNRLAVRYESDERDEKKPSQYTYSYYTLPTTWITTSFISAMLAWVPADVRIWGYECCIVDNVQRSLCRVREFPSGWWADNMNVSIGILSQKTRV